MQQDNVSPDGDRIRRFYLRLFDGAATPEHAPESYLLQCIQGEITLRRYVEWVARYSDEHGRLPSNDESRIRLEEFVEDANLDTNKQAAERMRTALSNVIGFKLREAVQDEIRKARRKERPWLREISVEAIGIIATPFVILLFLFMARVLELNLSWVTALGLE